MKSNKLIIFYSGEAAEEIPLLSRMRALLPEPARSFCSYLLTEEPQKEVFLQRKNDKPFAIQPAKTHLWEKILIHRDECSFYAWKHVATQYVLL